MTSSLVETTNAIGAQTVRLSDDDLHRAACKGLWEGHHIVFVELPALIDQLIKNKVWETRQRKFASFGEYALEQSSDGLGIRNNYLLWILRCSMDVHGRHLKEWADTLEEVEKTVKAYLIETGERSVKSFNGNALERLGRGEEDISHGHITYLPSRSKTGQDSQLIRLRKKAPEIFEKVTRGEMKVRDAVKEAGMQNRDSDANRDPVDRAMMYVRRMKKPDLARFIERLKDEGVI